jgi:light-regulated signal transduction histidine kinase (bacteriophytochrome)
MPGGDKPTGGHATAVASGETERLHELERRVEARTAELAAANKELEAFCYAVSHDLRAPLRSIDGFAFALAQDYGDKLDEEGAEFLGRIRNAAKRMDDLITALLSLSRLTTVPVELEVIDLSEMSSQVVSDLGKSVTDHAPRFEVQQGLMVQGDRRMVRAVLDNLIGNAVKFTAKTASPEIRIGRQGISGPFFVADNGVGFDLSQTPKLFQPFERYHNPKEFAGEGIGLATVQRIVRKHGGKIWVEAEPNKGATFYFTLG